MMPLPVAVVGKEIDAALKCLDSEPL
jgi:hypothetical protein